ncbi:hypothetical protein [Micromonospora tulbaghiae]|uniref:hypothetical protein n=1 Tax=Micromonospora tulbaghiae TaxID=479978 RepID=UPI0033FDFB22
MGKRAELQLTDGASQVLSAHLETTRNRILREVRRVYSQGGGPAGRVHAEDVRKAIRQLAVSDAKMHYVGMLRRVNRRLAYVAIVLGTASLLTFSAANLGLDSNAWYAAPLAMSLGVAGAAVTETVRSLLRRRQEDKVANARAFLRRFVELEISARNFVAREKGTAAADGPLSPVFETLVAEKIWSEKEVNTFRLLLRLRNSLVHEQTLELSQADLRVALQQIERLREVIPNQPVLSTFMRRQAPQAL